MEKPKISHTIIDRGLPYIPERKRGERVCDGNNAPPENQAKKPDMKRVPCKRSFAFESVCQINNQLTSYRLLFAPA
jgi:hypothetical protein